MSKEIIQEIKPYSCKPRAPRSVATPLGDRFMFKAKLSIGVNGEQIAERGEKIDLQAYIQASKASTDMSTIVARYKAGDETVLNVREGFYGDVDVIPSSVNDIDKIGKLADIAAEKFASLPEDVQAVFGSSENFLNAVLNNTVDSILAKAQEQAPKVEEEKGE